jgi:outer membrane biosynthesis protein TonB
MAEIFNTHEELDVDAQARARTFTRWLGGSILVHAALLAALVYVPALRDTFSLANELSGFRLVSHDYEKTKIYERAEIINLAAQQLYYPAGFFDATTQTPPSPNDPKFIATVNPTPEPTPRPVRVKPTPSPSPTEQTAKNEGDKNAKPDATPSPAEPQTVEEAEKRLKESNVDAFPEVNTKPFTDLLEQGRKMKEAGEIDLTGTVDLSAEADRENDGTLTNVTITGGSASNPKLKQLALDFIGAVSASKLLVALKDTRHLHMKVGLDDKQVTVRVLTEMPSESTAATRAQDFKNLLDFGKLTAKLKGKDELVLFTSTKINSNSKQVVLDFNLPRADAGALLTKLSAKNQTPPPTPGG